MFTPSNYQKAIFEWVLNGSGDAFVSAVAGSGKTTTLVQTAKLIVNKHADAIFVAFNTNIVAELNKRLPVGFKAVTINSLGNRALMKGLGKKVYKGFCPTASKKYFSITYNMVKDMGLEKKDIHPTSSKIEAFIKFGMAELCDWSDEGLLAVADHYGLEFPKKLSEKDTLNTVRAAYEMGLAQARQGIISFDEQIYLPVLWNMAPEQSSFILGDEAQDFSKAKLALLLMARKPGGRCLFVGDKNQSIYGFAGADAFAVQNILDQTNATVLPLSISYRCAKAIVRHAQELVPEIESAPDAPEGVVEWIKENTFLTEVKPGDLVLSRLTAPLVSLAIKLIAKHKPATVKGKDIAKSLLNCAKDALNGRYTFAELDDALDNYLNEQISALLLKGNSEKAILALADRVEGVRVCAEGFKVNSIELFEAKLEGIFSNENENLPGVITLSTIHRMKGGEAEDVYLLDEKLPLVWKGQLPWEREQENNLDYVARTRAKLRLRYFTREVKGLE